MSEFLKAHKEGTLYFCTLTTVDGADVFTRQRYAEVITDSLTFCQRNKGSGERPEAAASMALGAAERR